MRAWTRSSGSCPKHRPKARRSCVSRKPISLVCGDRILKDCPLIRRSRNGHSRPWRSGRERMRWPLSLGWKGSRRRADKRKQPVCSPRDTHPSVIKNSGWSERPTPHAADAAALALRGAADAGRSTAAHLFNTSSKRDKGKESASPMSAIITPERPDSADAIGLITELEAHLAPLYPPESRHGYSVEKLIAQAVAFFVLRDNGIPAGCG